MAGTMVSKILNNGHHFGDDLAYFGQDQNPVAQNNML